MVCIFNVCIVGATLDLIVKTIVIILNPGVDLEKF
jgi:hypothetical protein